MSPKVRNIFLVLIFLLAAALRLWNLDEVPPSLTWDEVAIGYNAWSILKTGQDEYGTSFPLSFRSFNDAKQPGLIYLTVLSEALFGLNAWAVRLPSAFFGILTLVFFYFLVKTLFQKLPFQEEISLLATFLLAINPWQINFSRGAFETNLSLFFLVGGGFFLFRALKKPSFFVVAAGFFIASMYSYYTTRIVIPLILAAFALVYRKELRRKKKWVFLGLLLGGLLAAPLVKEMIGGEGSLTRLGYVNIFTHQRWLADEYSRQIAHRGNPWWGRLFYNRRLAFFLVFAQNYLNSLSPDFIFANGIEMSGLFYLWEIITLPLGLVGLWQLKKSWKKVIFAWFLATPVAGGLSIGSPNPFRNLPNAPVMVLFSAYGLILLREWLKKKRAWQLGRLFLGAAVIFFLVHFCFIYFDYFPIRKAPQLGDGYQQLALFLESVKADYDRIWVTGCYWRPYIHLLFHFQYDPARYQRTGTPEGFDVFRFGRAEWDREGIFLGLTDLKELVDGKTLFILSPEDYKMQTEEGVTLSLVKVIDGRLTKEVFRAVELAEDEFAHGGIKTI